jgi:hypothetical protein
MVDTQGEDPGDGGDCSRPPAGCAVRNTTNPHAAARRAGALETKENNGYKDEIFTKRVRAGKRTYFFDVKSTKSEKDFYITITESKRVGDTDYEKHKIFLYKEDFEKFRDALAETVVFVQTQLLENAEVVKQA